MPVCGNYLFFELPKKIVLNPKDGGSAGSFASLRITSEANQQKRFRS